MKKTLKEELERIHTLNYGGVIKKKMSLLEDEKKADLVKDDVADFFKTLENIEDSVSEQNKGERTFQKNVETIQIGLMLLGYDLPQFGVDGKFGTETAAAVKKFKSENNLEPSKGMETFEPEDVKKMIELLKSKNIKKEDIQSYINQTINPSDRNYMKIDKKAQDLLNDEQFKTKLNEVCDYLGIEPDWLIKVMYNESGLNPQASNSIGCVGLVGFCPDTPRGSTKTFGKKVYNMEDLRQSPLLQLDAMKDMYGYYKGKIHSVRDLYLINFYPVAVGKGKDFVLGQERNSDSWIYQVSKQNPGFAKAVGKTPGEPITVGDFDSYIQQRFG